MEKLPSKKLTWEEEESGSFFKSISGYHEALDKAFKTFDQSVQELDLMMNSVCEPERQQLEEKLYGIVTQARAAFDQASRLMVTVMELYVTMARLLHDRSGCGDGAA
ncbi:hypothetical protein [Thermotoga sp. Ku-13t]|uniref:hypothetical protein n=1 Tax=Thermotoga sp. Ku-13t TaxID=1755813 RepID=UPI0013E9E444|nr:hypothetical protein [Thermotoga sp. Ku-13t]